MYDGDDIACFRCDLLVNDRRLCGCYDDPTEKPWDDEYVDPDTGDDISPTEYARRVHGIGR